MSAFLYSTVHRRQYNLLVKNVDSGIRVGVPVLLLSSRVNLGRLLSHSVFQCLYLYNDDDISAYLLGFLES